MHLLRADGADEHHAVRDETGGAALDVEEFLRPNVRSEASLRAHKALSRTPLSRRCSPPFFAHFTPVFSKICARFLRLGPGSRKARKNGGKTAKRGRKTAEKEWW